MRKFSWLVDRDGLPPQADDIGPGVHIDAGIRSIPTANTNHHADERGTRLVRSTPRLRAHGWREIEMMRHP
jgi:hypothetical protein